MLIALYTLFHSLNLSLQVLAAMPMAAIGAVAALWITGQSLTVASMVGFISLSGIASRNGILLMAHYLHLMRHEGESFTPAMIERAGKERLAPMLMTALTAGIGTDSAGTVAGRAGQGNPLSRGNRHSRRTDQFHPVGFPGASRPFLGPGQLRRQKICTRLSDINSRRPLPTVYCPPSTVNSPLLSPLPAAI